MTKLDTKIYKYSRGGISALFAMFGITSVLCAIALLGGTIFFPVIIETGSLYYLTAGVFIILGIFCLMVAVRRNTMKLTLTKKEIIYEIGWPKKKKKIPWEEINYFSFLKYPLRSSQIIKSEKEILYFDSAVEDYKEVISKIEEKSGQKLIEEKENRPVHWKEEGKELLFL